MKARLLLLLSSLLLTAVNASAGTAVKAVMEGVWASSTSVFVSTPSQRIEVGAGGIKFADATIQTTAASGSDTHCYRIDYTSFTAVASAASPAVLVSSVNYRMVVHVFQNTSNGKPYLRFNGDSAANYRYSGRGLFDQGSDVGNYSASDGQIILIGVLASNLAKAGTPVDGTLDFSTVWSIPKTVKVTGANFQWTEQSVPADASQTSGGRYSGSANLSSILIGTTAGTITGYFEIWNCGAWGFQN